MNGMKLLRTTLILFCATLLYGCLEETAYCPTDRNIIVRFVYVYNGDDYFAGSVQMVNLFVFDNTSGLLVHSEEVNYYQLEQFAGTMLNYLEPGEYRLVAWGNAGQHSTFGRVNEGDHFNTSYVGRQGVPRNTNAQPGNGDRLHFAPGLLTVPRSGDVEITMSFARAYIGLEVFVVNKFLYTGELPPPIIEIDGASSHFDFDRTPEGNITLREATDVQTQFVERPAVAMFRTKLFDNNANLVKQLRVHSAVDNEVHFTIDTAMFRQIIMQFMIENGIMSLKNDATPRRVIPIVIEFTGQDVEVSITVPNFELIPGIPVS